MDFLKATGPRLHRRHLCLYSSWLKSPQDSSIIKDRFTRGISVTGKLVALELFCPMQTLRRKNFCFDKVFFSFSMKITVPRSGVRLASEKSTFVTTPQWITVRGNVKSNYMTPQRGCRLFRFVCSNVLHQQHRCVRACVWVCGLMSFGF